MQLCGPLVQLTWLAAYLVGNLIHVARNRDGSSSSGDGWGHSLVYVGIDSIERTG